MPTSVYNAPSSEKTSVEDAVWTATGHERPIFLDEHGRRRRWVMIGGALGGGASTMWLGALIAGAIGFSTMPAVSVKTQPLVASRPAPAGSVRAAHHRHSTRRRLPGVAGPTELAVSRDLLSGR